MTSAYLILPPIIFLTLTTHDVLTPIPNILIEISISHVGPAKPSLVIADYN